MESSVKSSDVHEFGEKSRSSDIQSLYVEKAEGSGLKRQRQSPACEEFGLGKSKKKRSGKEVVLSSFESVSKKSKNSVNPVDELELDQRVLDQNDLDKTTHDKFSGEGNLRNLSGVIGVSPNLDADVIPVPKRPRCFTRRKKVQNSHLIIQAGDTDKVSPHAQLVKLPDQSVTPILPLEDEPKKADEDYKENNSSRAHSVRSSRSRESASLRYTEFISKIVGRSRGKRRESEPQAHIRVDRLEYSVNEIAEPREKLPEDNEENLEENAARMLLSRFDPSCTVFSGNGTASASQHVNELSVGSSIRGDFVSLQSNHSADLEANSIDAEGRILRPRRREKQKRQTRKRRHFYEIFLKNVDAHWVVNRRIKVFWPLDQSWYFGLVTSYDPQKKFHHVKYDDRDEEWINLQNERFKLLLLPSEAPHKRDSEKSRQGVRSEAEEDGNAEIEEEDDIGSYVETEPLISWLARANRQVKSSAFGVKKKRRLQSQYEDIATGMLSEDSVATLSGSLVDASFTGEGSKLSCDSVVPDKSDDKETSETSCSKDRMPRFVYLRKRLRQREHGWGFISDNSECRSIIVYDPHIFRVGRCRQVNEHHMLNQCFGVDDLYPGCVLWSGENLGLLKLAVAAMNSRLVTVKLSIQLQLTDQAFGAENLWMFRTLLLLQYGMVMVMWPKVQLKMLFVDNVVGLRFLLFEGCLMQAVAFVCMILVAFHQPNENGELLNQQLPVTSIRFEMSGFPRFRRRFIFLFYNFTEVKDSKWMYLDNELKKYCSVTKQLPLSECTYDNIKIFQKWSSLLPLPSACREPMSAEGSRKRSRQSIMHKRITKESTYVNMGLPSSTSNEKPKRVPQFFLPFAAAPTFFLGLHLKLLMEKNMASISLCNKLLLLEGTEGSSRLVADDSPLAEDLPDQITLDNEMECSLNRTAELSGLLSSADLDVDAVSMRNEVDSATTSQKCLDSKLSVVETSAGPQNSGWDWNNDTRVKLQRYPSHLFGSEQCDASSWPPVGEDHSSQEKRDTELMSRLNGIKVQIPTVNQVETQSCDVDMQGDRQSTNDLVWSVNDCATRSPNPTAPRSIWHRNKHSSGSLSFGYRSKMWPDGRAEMSHSGLVNGSRKPRSQISYMLPFGNYDFNSKPRSHHRKGRPYKRMKTDNEKTISNGSRNPQRRLELSCDANVLITVGDRGWRECGAHVVLECVEHNEWRLLVKVSGVTRHSYKAYQFLQPGTTNRYTHAMMWKGGKDWTLEFPDRSQWALFKEMHEECYNRNLRAASVKTIPIPGVRLIEETDDNVVEVPYLRSSPKYFLQVETDVDMALNPSRVLYDMDSDDEEWILKRRAPPDSVVTGLMEISEDMFERAMDMLEKVAYTQQREDFTGDELEELMVGGVSVDLIKDVYEYWKQKRQMRGMPLIRQLQAPLWERYQKQLRQWELGGNRVHHLPNGYKEKATLVEKPPMFAFCLRPRGLEVPNKGSKQRSHRKISSGVHSCGFSRDSEGHHSFGRKSNGFVYGGDERFHTAGSSHEYASSWQTSTRIISPRDAVSNEYLSMSSDGSEMSHHRKLHRSKPKSKHLSRNDSQMTMLSSSPNQSKRNGVARWNTEWPSQNQYQYQHQREGGGGFQRQRVEKLGGPDLDEFRLRDASSAAQHASNMAKLKREKAQRLLYRADLAIHKAMVALMTAEAMKAASASNDSIEDG